MSRVNEVFLIHHLLVGSRNQGQATVMAVGAAIPWTGPSRASNMASLKTSRGFDLPSSSSEDEEDTPLPFPTALPRSDFLAKGFQPAEYLSSLPQRHQTLEDLRSELRERSSAISAELLELVNNNYTAFLSLGSELRGGDEKVEDVKVALLGFRRAIEEVKTRVGARGQEVDRLNTELGEARSQIETGRSMLELDERLADLEHLLTIGSAPQGRQEGSSTGFFDSSDEGEDDTEDEDDIDLDPLVGTGPAKLAAFVRELILVERLADTIGRKPHLCTKRRRG
ncbi:unnamed protein product [Parascedosporium putredinis]|uniref:Conserved oligomeric Golgi complex subunit 2 n=1 Tax=Parascedosporium putredinis TaxID=1442378 RepID=A0A9P1GUF0_9PEZI|nr:unnamed protein product [Parascedosporium putredinis]CAI7987587.1 unnamed protein product [Parascedosporium putredinis]